ncbi:MAG: MFS transporter [Candidatus Njordarchaeia archaeon]
MKTQEVESVQEAKTTTFAILYSATYIFRIAFGATILLIDTYLIYLYHAAYFAKHGSPPSPSDPTLLTILILVAITYYLSESTFAGIIGYVNDHKDVRLVIIYSAFIGAIAMLSYTIAILIKADVWYDVIIFAIAHIIHGIASAMKVTSTVTFITRHSSYENRGRHMGLYDFTLFLGRVTGIGFAGFLWGYFATTMDLEQLFQLEEHGMSPEQIYNLIKNGLHSFWVLSILLVIAGIILFKLPSVPPEHKISKISAKDAALSPIREFLVMFKERRDLAIPWFFMSSLFGLVLLWGPRVLQIELGFSGEFSGYISAYIGLLLGLPAPLWGLVSDRIGRKKTIALGILGLLLLVAILAVAIVLVQIPLNDPMLFYLASPAVIFLAALGPSFLARLGDTSERGKHGEVMAGYQFTLALGEINGILSGAVAITLLSMLWAGSELEPLAGLAGIAILALLYFIIMVVGSLRIRPDEEVLEKYREPAIKND